jgi:hypothetical protein
LRSSAERGVRGHDEYWRAAERLEWMKYKLATTLLVVAGLVVATFSTATTTPSALAAKPTTTTSPPPAASFPVNGCPEAPNKPPPCSGDDAVVLWDDQLLDVIRAYPKDTGPTITARAMGVLHTATYDAWAAYDPKANVTRPDGPAQQDADLNTLPNKSEAISYAAYKVLNDLFPPSQFHCIPTNCPTDGTATYLTPDYLLRSQTYNPANTTPADPTETATTPDKVGNLAAQAVLDYRRGKLPRDPNALNPYGDGSNQLGDDPNGTTGPAPVPYSDTTVPHYKSVNTWKSFTPYSDPLLDDKWHWQPLCVLTADGVGADGVPKVPPIRDPSADECADGTLTTASHYTLQNPLTPQWGKVTPFAVPPSQFQYMVQGPPKNADGTYSTTDITTALADTSNLSDASKAKAEYWADGPRSEFPPGHMGVFAQFICRKFGNNLDSDTKMFFMLGNAMMDASIVAWWTKYKWDYVRPVTAIREYYKDQWINSWLGPKTNASTGNFGKVLGQNWMPYQALTVVTPPFPEYVSGHSTFSAAGASLLALANGGDTFGGSITIKAGSSKIEPNQNIPAKDVQLSWPTFTDASNEAGMSRRYGGIHFVSADLHGRAIGRQVAQYVYSTAQNYINGYTGKYK